MKPLEGDLEMLRKILLLSSIMLLAGPAAMAEGFYAGAGVGITQVEDSDQGITFKDSPFGWRLIAGFDMNENFAMEGSYINSGTAEDDIQGENVEAELSAFVFSLVGLIPVGETARLFGKIGYYSGETEVTVFGITLDEDEDGATAGAGVRFDMNNNFVIRGDLDWYDTELDTLWSVGVGFQYSFGK